jgi:hypothetical protein
MLHVRQSAARFFPATLIRAKRVPGRHFFGSATHLPVEYRRRRYMPPSFKPDTLALVYTTDFAQWPKVSL